MKTKKLVIGAVALSIILSSAITGAASQTVNSAPTNDFLTSFNYTAKENASAAVTYGERDGKTVFSEDFEKYDIGDADVKDYTGKDVNVTVEQKDGIANKTKYAKLRDWVVYTAYNGSAYTADCWIYTQNTAWGGLRIGLKENLYIAAVGDSSAAHSKWNTSSIHQLTLCGGTQNLGDVMNGELTEKLGSVDLMNDYGLKLDDSGAVHLRFTVTKTNIKLYLSPTVSFKGAKPIMDIDLPEQYRSSEYTFDFSKNSDMYIDDISVKSLAEKDLEPLKGESLKLVRNVDFETPSNLPENVTFGDRDADNANHWAVLNKGGWYTYNFADSAVGDRTTEFYLKTGNNEWDQYNISVCPGYTLCFRGSKHDPLKGNYSVHIDCNGTNISAAESPVSPTNGCYVKTELAKKHLKVWVSATNTNYGEPILDTELQNMSYGAGAFSASYWDGTPGKLDDVRITSATGAVIYENDFELNAYNTDDKVTIAENSGNHIYQRSNGGSNDWSDLKVFTVPQNFEMSFWTHLTNPDYQNSALTLTDDIKIYFEGRNKQNPLINLKKGESLVKSYELNADNVKNGSPFDGNGCKFKVRLEGNNIKVYMDKTGEFAESALIFNETLSSRTAGTGFLKIYNGNTVAEFDDFKVYEIVSNPNAGVLEKLELAGNSITLKKTAGKTEETVGTAELGGKTGDTYRISLAKTDGKLAVYVNGVKKFDCSDSIDGIICYDGDVKRFDCSKYKEPLVVGKGDLTLDGNVEDNDLMIMRQILLGIENKEDYVTFAADTNSDGTVDIRDLINVKGLGLK